MTIERNPLDCDRFYSSVAELNRIQSNGLGSICSIEFDWYGNRTRPKLGVRFCSTAELN